MSSNFIPFRDDDGNVEQVPFSEAMENMDGAGFLTLSDGRLVRRARDLEEYDPIKKHEVVEMRTNYVSDSLGFTKAALPEYQEHLRQSGCKGIEFREDPDVKGFIQVVCDSQAAKLAYAKTRGLQDLNSKNGGSMTLSAYDLKCATELASRSKETSKVLIK
jgi:hypothetical protein